MTFLIKKVLHDHMRIYRRAKHDVIHCYVKCQPEIDWLVKQSKVQNLLLILVGNLAWQRQCLQTLHPHIATFSFNARQTKLHEVAFKLYHFIYLCSEILMNYKNVCMADDYLAHFNASAVRGLLSSRSVNSLILSDLIHLFWFLSDPC
jgi:hypothetical protein